MFSKPKLFKTEIERLEENLEICPVCHYYKFNPQGGKYTQCYKCSFPNVCKAPNCGKRCKENFEYCFEHRDLASKAGLPDDPLS